MKIVAVIPAYNEAAIIEEVVRGVKPYVDAIVTVDDGSTDTTSLFASRSGAIVVRHLINRGQGAALETGMRLALSIGADIVVHFDADGQHDPRDIPAMIAPVLKGQAAVTLGSRFLGQSLKMPFSRRLILRLGILFTRFFSGLKLSDVHNGLRAFSRAAAEEIRLTHDGMAHAS